MRIVINRLAVSGSPTGVGHYIQELARNMEASAGNNTFDLFPSTVTWPAVRAGRAILPHLKRLGSRSARLGNFGMLRGLARAARAIGRQGARLVRAEARRYIRTTLSSRNYDLYHEPNFMPLPCDLPTAITVHDLSVLLFPQWHPPARVSRYEKEFRAGLARSSFVFTPSEYIRFQAIQLLNLPPDRVQCVYPGARKSFRPLPETEVRNSLRELGLPRDYFLYVGAIEPRKNLLMLLQVYCSLPRQVRERHPLILAGPWGWSMRSVANFYDTTARHQGVRHLGYVPEAFLPALYNGARCLVYPSCYEGFGFPPVEMMACGGAVVTSDIATLNETVGESAALISPFDADGWRAALLRAANDDDWINELRSRASHGAAPYSWQNAARQAWDVYDRILRPSLQRSSSAFSIRKPTSARRAA
jgi:alpha-1,3-rhamnosyl/mannosyltransferase